MDKLFRLASAEEKNSPAVDEWLSGEPDALFSIARIWFEHIRRCGDEVRELVHDGCPVACVGDVAFAYVNVFRGHVNVGFFTGALLNDPAGLLEGAGKRMRHVKIRPEVPVDAPALEALIEDAYHRVKSLDLSGQ